MIVSCETCEHKGDYSCPYNESGHFNEVCFKYENKHTPIPWEALAFDESQIVILGPRDAMNRRNTVGVLFSAQRRADAALIIEACNAYNTLRSELEKVEAENEHLESALAAEKAAREKAEAELELTQDAIAEAFDGNQTDYEVYYAAYDRLKAERKEAEG